MKKILLGLSLVSILAISTITVSANSDFFGRWNGRRDKFHGKVEELGIDSEILKEMEAEIKEKLDSIDKEALEEMDEETRREYLRSLKEDIMEIKRRYHEQYPEEFELIRQHKDNILNEKSEEKRNMLYQKVEELGIDSTIFKNMHAEIDEIKNSIDKEALKEMDETTRREYLDSKKEEIRQIKDKYRQEYPEEFEALKEVFDRFCEEKGNMPKGKGHHKKGQNKKFFNWN